MRDIEIAQAANFKNIVEVAENLGIKKDDLVLYGDYKAKLKLPVSEKNGNLVLVTAINPTPYGEGKTTVSIGLGDALNQLNKRVVLALREPSMGPVFGIKGGATGGGYSQVIPMEDINLHFTGDFHAITAANNLLSSAIDNHIFHGNELDICKVVFNRCLDVNDRALRSVAIGDRVDEFSITAASEIMALFCLATSLDDLRRRLGNIVIGYNSKNEMIYAKDLKIEGALTVLLKDAFMPNLVQTLEHTPAIIHGGPFANIAHGCNSIVATKIGLSVADYVITEAGFGADLGAEKFFDIKCRKAGLKVNCVVLVATIKALKYNGGENEDIALELGLANLGRHIDNLKNYGVPIIVCLNKYETDTCDEIEQVSTYCERFDVDFSVSTAYADGGRGAIDLAEKVEKSCTKENNFHLLYEDKLSVKEKIEKVCTNIYHASEVKYSDVAMKKISEYEKKYCDYPVCIAKTQYSFSDNASLLGAPDNFSVTVRDVRLYNGAEFITVLLGNIMTMPGLPTVPNYERIDFVDNKIIGLD